MLKLATILTCVDETPASEGAASLAALLAHEFGARVDVLGLAPRPDYAGPVRRAADAVAHAVLSRGQPAVVLDLVHLAASPIARRAAAYDLVVLGADLHRRTVPLLGRPIVLHLVGHVRRPVIVVHGRPERLARVLVCVGGAAASLAPIRWGTEFAAAVGARCDMLHVLEPVPLMYAALPRMVESADDLLHSRTEEGHVMRHAARCARRVGVECDVLVARGDVVVEAARVAREGEYDLIVGGSFYARPGVAKYAVGNLTSRLAMELPVPVLIVPSHFGRTAAERRAQRQWRQDWQR
jgi:nucleotide-binding universal stress UspA family protein